MITLYTAVFVASFLGSLHCAGMCGPFVVFAVSGRPELAPQKLAMVLPGAAYHAARLTGYVLLGAVFGLLGSAVDFGGGMAGVQRAAAWFAGGTLMLIGVATFVQYLPLRLHSLTAPAWLRAIISLGQRRAAVLRPTPRAALVGALSALLPCGWLWAFVVAAGGTGSAAAGAGLMLAFWAGTMPILASIGLATQRARALLGARLQPVVALALAIIGAMTVTGRIGALNAIQAQAASPVDSHQLTSQVEELRATEPPCCQSRP